MKYCRSVCILMAIVLGLAVAMALIMVFVVAEKTVRLPHVTEPAFIFYRVDCHPEPGSNPSSCHQRGCKWQSSSSSKEPSCFFPEGQGYRMESVVSNTTRGLKLRLRKQGNLSLPFAPSRDVVQVDITYITNQIVRVKFWDPNVKRYEVPEDPPLPSDLDIRNKSYDISIRTEPQFGLTVRRRPPPYPIPHSSFDLTLIFDTRNPGFVFSDQFLQLTTRLPSGLLYGIGDHQHDTLYHDVNWRSWGLFARQPKAQFYTSNPVDYSPGVHPFYLNIESDGNCNGVFLRNSDAMEIVVQPEPAITYRALGGVLDFFVFLGPTPEEVLKQYMKIIGRPMLPPYWSLGFQIGREKYDNDSYIKQTFDRMIRHRVPFDAIHLGTDILERGKNFIADSTSFGGLQTNIAAELRREDIRLVLPVFGPLSAESGNYAALDKARQLGILIMDGAKEVTGKMQRDITAVYPDYSHPSAADFYIPLIKDFTQRSFVVDALSLDLNVPVDVGEGSTSCPNDNWNKPKYKPVSIWESESNAPLHHQTPCLHWQTSKGRLYDTHNLYCHQQAQVAYRAIQYSRQRRPLVVSRGTAPGTGRFAGHWLGNTESSFSDLRRSVIGMLEFNMFGIPLKSVKFDSTVFHGECDACLRYYIVHIVQKVGADICGFYGNTTDELCKRWLQAGAFYPFARSYNAGNFRDQDPPALGSVVLEAAKNALYDRYRLLPYLYTLFFQSYNEGGSVARPLFHEYPKDNATWRISTQFLWGKALMISPWLTTENDLSDVNLYFPEGRWYDYYTGAEIDRSSPYPQQRSRYNTSLHVRGGHVIPFQHSPNITTYNSNPLGLIVALDNKNSSTGNLYLDDKETMDYSRLRHTFIRIRFEKDVLVLSPAFNGFQDDRIYIQTVEFWGVQGWPERVLVNSSPISNSDYTLRNKVLRIYNLRFRINQVENRINLEFRDYPRNREDYLSD